MSGFTSAIPQQPQTSANATIVNPLDANGNMKVDLEVDSTGTLSLMGYKLSYVSIVTYTPLGANATYTSGFFNRNYNSALNGTIKAFAISDQPYTLYIDYSLSTTNVDYSIEAPSAAIGSPYVAGAYGSQFSKITDELIDQYFRLRIVNGSTAQTYLRSWLQAENS